MVLALHGHMYIPIYALMITYLRNLILFYKFFRKWSVKNELHFINWGNKCILNMLYIFCKHMLVASYCNKKAVFESLFIDSISDYVVI